MELVREEHTTLDISSEGEVLSYTYTDTEPIEVIIRVELGDDTSPIVGNNTYTMKVYIGEYLISPNSDISVPSGVFKAIVMSRIIPIEEDDEISVTVVGNGLDTSVYTLASLRDVTAIKIEDVVGTGAIAVDHDYGGTDELSYKTAGGSGVSGAAILVYLTSDYDAGNRENEFIIGKTSTTTGGAWLNPLMLDAEDYTLIYYKTGAYGPDREDITVA